MCAWSTCVKEPLCFEQIKECADEPVGKGYLVSCLVDHRGNITEYQCHQYITKMTAIIFSDYRLICGFMDDCKNDINILKCGSIRLGEKVTHCIDFPQENLGASGVRRLCMAWRGSV